jgi:hypothetical protein
MKVLKTNVALMIAIGCNSTEPTDPPLNEMTQAVAKISTTEVDTFVVAVTDIAHQARLGEVLGPNPPNEFRWLKIKVLPPNANQVSAAAGFQADMTAQSSLLTFTQTYQDFCNPRINDYSACWFSERLTAGDPGVSGHIHVQKMSATVRAAIEVQFQGTTTMYGLPATVYGHGTSSGFDAPVVESGVAQ